MPAVEVLDEAVPLRDGVRLRADVILRRGAGPSPALLIRTPYSRGATRMAHDVVGLARDGWAVVVQDVRGRFDSGGVFTPFSQEVEDGYDSVAWCTGQAWCDGRVAMTGWSYVGATQWLAALGGHPALRAINPVVGAGDIAEEMLHQGGAFQIGLAQPWALGLAATDPRAEPAVRSRAGEFGARWRELLAAPADDDPVGEVFAPYRGWRRGDGPAPVGVTGRYGELDVAVHQVGGWYDIFCESALRHHTAMATGARSGRARAAQRLVIGPWSHSNGLSNTHPEHDFGGAANGGYGGVLGAALRWTRRALDDEQVEGGIACFVMGEDRWVELDSWPPPARDMLLHLGAGGLAHEPGTGTDVLLHEPSSPVPTRGGRVLGPFLPMAGPVDQRPVEHREDVLVYTGEVLAAPVRVMGPVRLEARVDSTAAVYDLAVKLCDVHPDGRVLNVVDGVRRVRATPGEVTRVVVEVGSTAHVFRAGHRVRLHLAGSNFPRFDVTPEAGRHRVQRQGAALHLPVVVA